MSQENAKPEFIRVQNRRPELSTDSWDNPVHQRQLAASGLTSRTASNYEATMKAVPGLRVHRRRFTRIWEMPSFDDPLVDRFRDRGVSIGRTKLGA
jgi:hypothetical protein